MNSTNGTTTGKSLPHGCVTDILHGVILVSTIIGNFLLILSLTIRKGSLKLVDKLMLNTVGCNILLVVISIPMEVVLQHMNDYPFTNFVCKLIHPLSTYLLNSCVFTYVAIAIERWIVVSSFHNSPPNKVHTVLVFLVIHLCGLFSITPYMPVLKVHSQEGRRVCSETWEMSSRRSYTLLLFLLQYGVPVPLLVVFYAKTWFIVFHSNKKVITSMLHQAITTITINLISSESFESLKKACNTFDEIPSIPKKSQGRKCMQRASQKCSSKLIIPSLPQIVSGKSLEIEYEGPKYFQQSSESSSEEGLTRNILLDVSCANTPYESSFETRIAITQDPNSIDGDLTSTLLVSEAIACQEIASREEIEDMKRKITPNSRKYSEARISRQASTESNTNQTIVRKISNYFSVTGGLPVEDCVQTVACKKREKQTKRLLSRFTIITLVFILCMLPNQILWLIIDFFEKGNEFFSPMTRTVIHLITYANCFINPFLYGNFNEQFCLNIRRVFRRTSQKIRKNLPNYQNQRK